MNTQSINNNVVDTRILNALADQEWGDARSYLDELIPDGQASIAQLNALSNGTVWHYGDDGWSYTEAE